jgi:nucleotide-binding universal stress UspA family protein
MKILIGYDGSESSDGALEDLRRAGLPESAEVLVMTIADVFIPPPISEADDMFPMQVPAGVRRAHQRAERKLKEAGQLGARATDRIRKYFPKWEVHHEAFADSPAWAIIRKADERNPDLIVVGAHGHSILGGRLILGSVSQRVLYQAKTSVRIARGRGGSPDAPVRIVIGLDGSPDSNAAVTAVSERNWPQGTEVRLISVVDSVMAILPEPFDASGVKWIETDEEANWDEVRQHFEPMAEKLRAADLRASVIIRRGNAKDELVNEAQSWSADCVFLGAKGMRGIQRLLLGSVSAAVAASAHCSVEIVRPGR